MQITVWNKKPSSQEKAYFGHGMWGLKEKTGIKFGDSIETEKSMVDPYSRICLNMYR